MLGKQEDQKSQILTFFKNEMSKSGSNYDDSELEKWEECVYIGGWKRTHVK